MKIWHGLMAGGLALTLATPAFAQKKDRDAADNNPTAINPKASAASDVEVEDEDQKAWSVGVSIGSRIGQGTFVNVSGDTEYQDPNCVNPIVQGCVGDASNAFDRANLTYGINGSYTIKDFTFSTGLSLSQWLTPGGGLIRPNEIRLQDSGLGVGYKGWTIDSVGVSFRPNLGLSFPTNRFAQLQTLILGTNLGLSISKQLFNRLGLSLSIGVGRFFHSSEAPLLDAEKLEKELTQEELENLGDEIRPEAVVYRPGEEVRPGLVSIGGVNTAWALSTGVSAGFAVYKKLRLSASYRIATSWTYAIDDNPEVRPEGDFIQGNRGVGQSFGTSIGLSYPVQVKKVNLGFSAGIGTGGFPKTSDNQSFRFPFWNTSGAGANASSVRLGVSASY